MGFYTTKYDVYRQLVDFMPRKLYVFLKNYSGHTQY